MWGRSRDPHVLGYPSFSAREARSARAFNLNEFRRVGQCQIANGHGSVESEATAQHDGGTHGVARTQVRWPCAPGQKQTHTDTETHTTQTLISPPHVSIHRVGRERVTSIARSWLPQQYAGPARLRDAVRAGQRARQRQNRSGRVRSVDR